MRAISYVRVSTTDQRDSGAGVGGQRTTIESALAHRGWELLTEFSDEGVSGGVAWNARPGLSSAVAAIESGGGDILVVAKLDRLTRSVGDFANLVARAKKKKWKLLILDVGLDLSTPSGELMANILAAFAAFEKALIGQRTKEGMAAKKAAGTFKGPVGRPSGVSDVAFTEMIRLRDMGWGYAYIARYLSAEGFATPQGAAAWSRATVRSILLGQGEKE